ncbi:MAG: hypothetical protein QG656_1466 [Candidatus Hydrogenedentes bacterium]|nr:hypothetical protein [Candidatus Hydrogenedentota bacterium]
MKTKTKEFDCVEMMHRGALRIHEATKEMTVEEELAYWREQHAELMAEWKRSPETTPEEK